MKTILKWILFIITLLIFLYVFSSSYRSRNIDVLDHVVALGIDSVEDSSDLLVSFEFLDVSSFSSEGSSDEFQPVINSVQAPSLEYAINLMNAYLGKQLSLSHCKVIVFSKDLAENGLLEETSYLMNNIQIRPTSNIVISNEKASSYLENSSSTLEKVLTKYYDIFPTSSEYTGYTSNIILGNFYENTINSNLGGVAILGNTSSSNSSESNDSGSSSEEENSSDSQNSSSESSSSSGSEKEDTSTFTEDLSSGGVFISNVIIKGDRGTENIGLCVLKDSYYLGELSATETLCYSLLKNEVDSFVIKLNNPFFDGQKIDIQLDESSSSSINIDTSNDTPVIDIKLNLTGHVSTLLSGVDYSDKSAIDTLNNSVEEYLKESFLNYLNKTSTEFKADINGFGDKAKRNFLTISDFENYNWTQKYENANFNIEVNSNIISGVLMQNN